MIFRENFLDVFYLGEVYSCSMDNIALPLLILNNLPWFWLGVVVVMLVVEALTQALTSIWMAIAAFVTMFVAFFLPSLVLQTILFLAVSLGLLIYSRPFFLRKMGLGKERTNADRLVGKTGLVLEPISQDSPGQVKVEGQVWTAKPSESLKEFAKGEHVEVVEIKGVSLFVKNRS